MESKKVSGACMPTQVVGFVI